MKIKEFNKKKSIEVWNQTFGVYTTSGTDIFGRKVYFDDFVCAHILPKEMGGKSKIENAIILNPRSYEEKGILLNGIINNRKFEIVNSDGIGKIKIK